MILSNPQIKALLRGKIIEHTIEAERRPHAPGSELAAQLSATKAATTRVIVEKIVSGPSHGIWTLTLRPIQREPARLLTRSGKPTWIDDEDTAGITDEARGYTSGCKAMPGVGEAIDEETLAWYAAQADRNSAQRELLRDAEELRSEVRTLEDRAQACERVAREKGIDVSDDLAVYRTAHERAKRRLDAIEEKIHGRRKVA